MLARDSTTGDSLSLRSWREVKLAAFGGVRRTNWISSDAAKKILTDGCDGEDEGQLIPVCVGSNAGGERGSCTNNRNVACSNEVTRRFEFKVS